VPALVSVLCRRGSFTRVCYGMGIGTWAVDEYIAA